MTEVKIQKVLDVPTPEYGTSLSAGFDIAVAEDVRLYPGETKVYRTGLIVQSPPDHMLLVVPRSSTQRKWGVTLGNTVGIIDEDYCGPEDELKLQLSVPPDLASYQVYEIPAGTRLAQGIFIPITRATFVVQDDAIAATRGGWGSTGD